MIPHDIAEALVTTRRECNEKHARAQDMRPGNGSDAAWADYYRAAKEWADACLLFDAWLKTGSVC